MANLNPSFLVPPGHTSNPGDTKITVLQKIHGILIDIFAPMNTSPTFYPSHHTPSPQDTEYVILQKILGTLEDIETGGGGGSSLTGNFSGLGSPEGVVTASEGASYLDLTDPNNPNEWKKTSGISTNTGWINFAG